MNCIFEERSKGLSINLTRRTENELDRIDLWVKAGVGVIAGIVSITTGVFGITVAALIYLMGVDFVTGVIAAAFTDGLSSKKGYKGLFKKIYTLLLVTAVYVIENAILKSHGVVADGVAGAFVVIEFVSIVENGTKMGMKIDFLNKYIAIMKNKTGNNNDSL